MLCDVSTNKYSINQAKSTQTSNPNAATHKYQRATQTPLSGNIHHLIKN